MDFNQINIDNNSNIFQLFTNKHIKVNIYKLVALIFFKLFLIKFQH